ncbi:hypothetical protein ACLOJK_041749 [Asimina triloba]
MSSKDLDGPQETRKVSQVSPSVHHLSILFQFLPHIYLSRRKKEMAHSLILLRPYARGGTAAAACTLLANSKLAILSRTFSCNGFLHPSSPPTLLSSSSAITKVPRSTPGFVGLFVGLGPRTRRFTIQATNTQVSDSGSIDSPLIQAMQKKYSAFGTFYPNTSLDSSHNVFTVVIKEQLNADEVFVKDAYGDGQHVSIDVVSSAFEGQSAVNRQRMVYKAIWEELQGAVHAVDQMTTRTPAEAAENHVDSTIKVGPEEGTT